MTRSRYRIAENDAAYFLTCTAVGWLPVFARPKAVEIVLDSWRFLQHHRRLTIYGYVVLENHVHLIASASDLAKEIGDFKSFTARQIIDSLRAAKEVSFLEQLRSHMLRHKSDREYQLWQEGSHPQQIGDEEMMRQKLEYIHLNPVKRGYVDDPTHWRYSSARDYMGQKGLIPVELAWN